ncbi:prolipoprotein diacylglyceryl transferase [Ammonifex degensii KC4]|uniref:Phosphatidylglycerol--prolipoprotein diacylglyceryl transferase n=1 Tax=Ammonifex degensii (strain DSM 10501 / KC4) TaxID=429009 RepID=C9RCT2_AMMDK|nr:prolipoprotein diacylglyceryl transferase [Ammonifex degensii]ACX52059.1 prolipoprotein diacylglyceryl transferase [Ammonifex degensii KC4]
MHPILFHLGPLTIYSYGAMLALAVLVGLWIAQKEALRRKVDPDFMPTLAFWAVLAGLIGARLAYVVVDWSHFASNPVEILFIWDGGLTFYGAVILAVPVALWLARRWRLPFGTVADLVAVAAAAGYPIARIGCFLNGCCYGKPTNLPWAVAFPFDGIPRHPTQLYSSFAGLIIFLILWRWRSKESFPGELALLYLALYCVYRFFIEFFRVTPLVGSWLNLGQVASLILLGLTLVTWLVLRRRLGGKSGV